MPSGVCSSVIYGRSRFARLVRFGGRNLCSVLSLDQLLYLSAIPSAILYSAIQHLYVPLIDSQFGKRILPLREGMIYWSEFDREWLWKAVVFDILASSPVTTHTSEAELVRTLGDLPISRYECRSQFGAMWNVLMYK